MAEEWELVERVSEAWGKHDKGVAYANAARRSFLMLFEAAKMQWMLSIHIGPRGGVKGRLTVIDPTKKVLADQLVYYGTERDPYLVHFSVFSDFCERVHTAPTKETEDAAVAYLQCMMDHVKAQDPAVLRGGLEYVANSLSQRSVYAWSGGATGLVQCKR